MSSSKVFDLTPEQFDRNARNILFSISQLVNVVPTDEMIEEYKSKLLESGRINILENKALSEQNTCYETRVKA